nr:hypothetical protein GACBDANE_00026 [Spodoptera litura nucleopolyhedrovirus]
MSQMVNMFQVDSHDGESITFEPPQVKTTIVKNQFQMEIMFPFNIKNLILEKIYKNKKSVISLSDEEREQIANGDDQNDANGDDQNDANGDDQNKQIVNGDDQNDANGKGSGDDSDGSEYDDETYYDEESLGSGSDDDDDDDKNGQDEKDKQTDEICCAPTSDPFVKYITIDVSKKFEEELNDKFDFKFWKMHFNEALLAGGFLSHVCGDTTEHRDIDVFIFSGNEKILTEEFCKEYDFKKTYNGEYSAYSTSRDVDKDKWTRCESMECDRFFTIKSVYWNELKNIQIIVLMHEDVMTVRNAFGIIRNFDLPATRRGMLIKDTNKLLVVNNCLEPRVYRESRVKKYLKRGHESIDDSNVSLPPIVSKRMNLDVESPVVVKSFNKL